MTYIAQEAVVFATSGLIIAAIMLFVAAIIEAIADMLGDAGLGRRKRK